MPTPEFEADVEMTFQLLNEFTADNQHIGAMPPYMRDQLSAAVHSTERTLGPFFQKRPEMEMHSTGWDASLRAYARALVTVGRDIKPCPHLSSPVECYLLLAPAVMACPDCLASFLPDLAEADALYGDRCDWCRDTGITRFTPHVLRMGPLSIIGDACPPCDRVLRGGDRADG